MSGGSLEYLYLDIGNLDLKIYKIDDKFHWEIDTGYGDEVGGIWTHEQLRYIGSNLLNLGNKEFGGDK